ncbi:hypothetical protein [uncultured Abyssibacter sp.]|uniref:hypothetical protein n=1 Tax=uncultured Abyssibacter sp. TaxID=2320202 RepID=UPI0032B1E99A
MAEIDQNWVNSLEYRSIVAPSLKVCASLAASRNEPWLATDLPCMLALHHVVTKLLGIYSDEWGNLGDASSPEALEKMPDATLALVMQEAEFSREAVAECIDAVHRAYDMLLDARVIATTEPMLAAAWRAMTASDDISAEALIGAVAGNVVQAIDEWEQSRTRQ